MQWQTGCVIGLFLIISTLRDTLQLVPDVRKIIPEVKKFGKEQVDKVIDVTNEDKKDTLQLVPDVRKIIPEVKKFGKVQVDKVIEVTNEAKNDTFELLPDVSKILPEVQRFGKEQVNKVIEVKNAVEQAVWERLKDDFFTIYRHAAIETRDIQNKPVTEDEVSYYLYTNEYPKEYSIAIDTDNLERFRNRTNQIVFLIHGWTNSRENEWMEDMKNAFLVKDKDSFVILVDWKEPANQFYYVSSINTYDVSKYITKFLVNLYKNYGVDKKNFLLVGHSLGGQITGFVGELFEKETLEKLPRIIALDPAGPLFTTRPTDKRLNKDNAEVVQVIHTDGGTFGFQNSCGTIDFFVNGGSSQPGCKRIDLELAEFIGSLEEPNLGEYDKVMIFLVLCDHRRAWAYFIEALLNPTEFVAQKCSSWEKYKDSNCDQKSVPMGDLTTNETGEFYLETNKEKPYSKKATKGFNLSRVIQH